MSVILLVVTFLLNSAAHIALKLGANSGLHLQSYNPVYLVKENFITLTGLTLFVLSAGFYFSVLRIVPVSVAYPVSVISSFMIINFFAFYFLKESVNLWQLLGYLCLLLGLGLIYFFRT